MIKEIILQDRAIVEIKGADRKSFLQGLITNDVNNASADNLIYAAMLNAQGRFLYDFFIFEKDSSLFLDCLASRRDEICTKFKFYKLRAQVEIIKNDDYEILQDFKKVATVSSLDISAFNDPRHKNLGRRIYRKIMDTDSDFHSKHQHLGHNDNDPNHIDSDEYHYRRICLKVPESEHDLTYEKSIIAEFDFDNLNAIDYKKGCYIGQELTARTHYMGQVRKKIFHIKIADLPNVEKNSEISCEGKNGGIILSAVYYESELHALALIKISTDEAENIDKDKISKIEGNKTEPKYEFQNNKITIIS